MTIAIAIHATDGIVVAADTLESYGGPGTFRTDQSKIHAFTDEDYGVCMISGAGQGDFIDGLKDQLADVYLHNSKEHENDLVRLFGECAHRFHKDHVLPYAPYPGLEHYNVQMLLALHGRRFEQGLILTAGTGIVSRGFSYAAVGAGTATAKALLHRFRRRADVRATSILAAYVIFAVKEVVEGCGRYTTVASINAPRLVRNPQGQQELVLPDQWWTETEQDEIDELERAFRRKHARAEKDLLWKFIDRWITRSDAPGDPAGQAIPQESKRGRKAPPPSRG